MPTSGVARAFKLAAGRVGSRSQVPEALTIALPALLRSYETCTRRALAETELAETEHLLNTLGFRKTSAFHFGNNEFNPTRGPEVDVNMLSRNEGKNGDEAAQTRIRGRW